MPMDSISMCSNIFYMSNMDADSSLNILESKLGGAFNILKSTHFDDGQRHWYLPCVIPEEKYGIVIVEPAWIYAALVNPGAYVATALAAGVRTAH